MPRLNFCDPFLKQIVSKQKVASVRLALRYDSKEYSPAKKLNSLFNIAEVSINDDSDED